MDSYELFKLWEKRFRLGFPLFEDIDDIPEEDRLRIENLSGQTSFMRGRPEEITFYENPEETE